MSNSKSPKSMKTRLWNGISTAGISATITPSTGHKIKQSIMNCCNKVTTSPDVLGNYHTEVKPWNKTVNATFSSGLENYTTMETVVRDMFWKANCGPRDKEENVLVYYFLVQVLILLPF